MAKVTKKTTASNKRRVKKNVERGQALIPKEMLFPGQVPVVLVLEVQENLLLMQLRLPQRQLQKQLWFTV